MSYTIGYKYLNSHNNRGGQIKRLCKYVCKFWFYKLSGSQFELRGANWLEFDGVYIFVKFPNICIYYPNPSMYSPLFIIKKEKNLKVKYLH